MFIFGLICILVLTPLASAVEVCNWEIFQPRCSNNEIIVIEEAVFGRKTMGRCLTEEGVSMENNLEDPKFLGCYADVKGYLEQQCAGKTMCDITVAKIGVNTKCHKWLKFHLEIQYSCLPVVQESRHCSVNLATGKQYISNKEIQSCGSINRPWMIESTIGQQINIKMVYMVDSKNSKESRVRFMKANREPENLCPVLGEIIERQNKYRTLICLVEHNSHSVGNYTFVTESNSIEILLRDSKNTSSNYVLAFEATGCSDLIPPSDAWMKRKHDEATIGCYSTRLRWQLKCLGQRWVGVIGNCSQGYIMDEFKSAAVEPVNTSHDQIVPIVSIAVAGFVVCFFIVCIGTVFLNRYYAMSKSRVMKQAGILRMGGTGPTYNDESYGKYAQDTLKTQNGNLIHFSENANNLPDSVKYYELDQTIICKELPAQDS